MNTVRFWNTVKMDFACEWKTMFKMIMGIAFILFITYSLKIISLPENPDAVPLAAALGGLSAVTLFVLFFFMGIGSCYVTYNMRTKQQRTAFLALPASPLDKFLSRFLWCTVGFFLTFVAGLILADLMQMLLCLVVHGDTYGSITVFLIRHIPEVYNLNFLTSEGHVFTTTEKLSALGVMASLFLCTHSVYLLGGVLFRRYNWILTTIALYAILPLLGVFNFMDIDIDIDPLVGPDGVNALAGIFITVMLLVTAFNYWASYRLFCRMQVICNKIINV